MKNSILIVTGIILAMIIVVKEASAQDTNTFEDVLVLSVGSTNHEIIQKRLESMGIESSEAVIGLPNNELHLKDLEEDLNLFGDAKRYEKQNSSKETFGDVLIVALTPGLMEEIAEEFLEVDNIHSEEVLIIFPQSKAKLDSLKNILHSIGNVTVYLKHRGKDTLVEEVKTTAPTIDKNSAPKRAGPKKPPKTNKSKKIKFNVFAGGMYGQFRIDSKKHQNAFVGTTLRTEFKLIDKIPLYSGILFNNYKIMESKNDFGYKTTSYGGYLRLELKELFSIRAGIENLNLVALENNETKFSDSGILYNIGFGVMSDRYKKLQGLVEISYNYTKVSGEKVSVENVILSFGLMLRFDEKKIKKRKSRVGRRKSIFNSR